MEVGSAIYILQTPGRDLDLYIACPLSVEWAECHGSLPNRPNHEYWLAEKFHFLVPGHDPDPRPATFPWQQSIGAPIG